MVQRNTRYTLSELKDKYDNEYIEIIEYHNANNILCKCKLCGETYRTRTGNLNRGQIHRKHTGDIYNKRSYPYTVAELNDLYEDEYKTIVEYIDAKHIKCLCKVCNKQYLTSVDSIKRHCIHKTCYTKFCDGRCTPEKLHDKLIALQSVPQNHCDILQYLSYDNVIVQCKHCGKIYSSSTTAIHEGHVHIDCTNYNISTGEVCIRDALDNLHIEYYTEFSFDDCRYVGKLRFDFYLPKYNMCIEFQGEQHYRPVSFYNEDENIALYNFILSQKRDNIKREYCKKNNITLLEIKYDEKDKIPEIIDNVLSKINM